MKKKIISSLIWLLLFCFFLETAQQILFFKDRPKMDSSLSLFELPSESIDVFFVGSSHVYSAVNPLVIWHEQGILTHNASTSAQPVWASTALIEDLIRTQKPELIVLEVYQYAWSCDYPDDHTGVHRVYDPMRFSFRKLRNVHDLGADTGKTEILFPIIKNHQRLIQNALTPFDFSYPFEKFDNYSKGFKVTFASTEKSPLNGPLPETTRRIEGTCENHLQQAIDSCKKSGTPLLLLVVPGETYPETLERYNDIARIAAENEVPFLNLNQMSAELGMDYQEDFLDNDATNTHLNAWGAEKVSSWLGEYIHSHYQLMSHSGEKAYLSWDRDYAHYENLRDLTEVTQLEEYLKRLSDPLLLSVISAGYADTLSLPSDAAETLASYGFKRDLSKSGTAGFIGVIDHGSAQKESWSGNFDVRNWYQFSGNYFYVSIRNELRDHQQVPISVRLNNHVLAEYDGGLNILVYERETDQLIDQVTFTADDGWQAHRKSGED